MAVQAPFPYMLNNNRGDEQGMIAPYGFLDQSGAIFFANGGEMGAGNGNARKRGRQPGVFSQSPAFIDLTQLQGQQGTPQMVSTGLRLAFEGQNQQNSVFSAGVSDEILAQQREEMEQVLMAQGEQLRQALTERWRQHHHSILVAADQSLSYHLRQKSAEAEQACRRTAELEDRLNRLKSESLAWQAKAMADQATAASLQSQIQLAAARVPGKEESGESPDVSDAESTSGDPEFVEPACRVCRRRQAEVVVLPCRHLCVCGECDAVAGEGCAVCGVRRTGSVQVFFS